MKSKQACRIHMILRYLFISCVVVFGVISIIGSGGGGGDDGGGGGGSAPDISNLSFYPTSTLEGSGGGSIPVSGTLDFVDNDGNVSTLTLNIFDSNDNLLDSRTDPIEGILGLTSGMIQGVFYINTSVVGEYPLEIYITDTTNLSSNILSGIFTVIHDDTKDLDSTFGNDGIALYETTPDYINEEGRAVAIQTDGKIVVAGYTNNYVLLLRYNNDGTLDNTFGTNGVVLYDGGSGGEAYAISLQPDGKIVVAGYIWNDFTNGNDVLLLRYNNDGTLDNTFGANGVVTYDNVYETGKAIKIQPDNKIVVVGGIWGENNAVLVLRYTDDGTLDNTFGTNGVVTYNMGTSTELYGHSVTLQPDGKIVVVGYYISNILVLRYNIDGTLDTSFSGDGVGMYSTGGIAHGYGVALQTDGKIVVTGNSSLHDSYSDLAVLTIRIIVQ